MDSATRRRILDLLSDLSILENCPAASTINWLYGAFDGFDYGDSILAQHTLLNGLNAAGNGHIVNEILAIVAIIKNYPRVAMADYTNL
jgi:hypothetical protein